MTCHLRCILLLLYLSNLRKVYIITAIYVFIFKLSVLRICVVIFQNGYRFSMLGYRSGNHIFYSSIHLIYMQNNISIYVIRHWYLLESIINVSSKNYILVRRNIYIKRSWLLPMGPSAVLHV